MSDFLLAAQLADIPDPGRRLVEVDERLIVLIRAAGGVYALDDVCTHDGGPLGEGDLDGYQIICPRHGARFDVRTGAAVALPATRGTVAHEVRIDGENVYVKLNDKAN